MLQTPSAASIAPAQPKPTKGILRWMSLEGDEKLTWDHMDDVQTKRARDKFNELIERGYKAYASKDIAGQRRGEEIKEFDPTAERLILTPQTIGG